MAKKKPATKPKTPKVAKPKVKKSPNPAGRPTLPLPEKTGSVLRDICIKQIKAEGLTVPQLTKELKTSPSLLYAFLRRGSSPRIELLEKIMNRLSIVVTTV